MGNQYLAKQLSGPVASSIEPASIGEFSLSDGVLNYLQNLSLDSADSDVLAILGELIGLPWPSAPAGTYDNNFLLLTQAADAPQYSALTGLGSTHATGGGLLSSTTLALGSRIPVDVYRQLLYVVAKIKQEGLTLQTLDDLVAIFTTGYTISWNSFHDVVVTFSPDLDTGSLYTLNLIVDLFMIDPIILFVQS